MLGRSVGLERSTIAALGQWRDNDAFDAHDRLVLEFAEALSQESRIDDALFARLQAEFAQPALVRLAMTIALAGMVNRIHAAFHTDVDASTLTRLAPREPS